MRGLGDEFLFWQSYFTLIGNPLRVYIIQLCKINMMFDHLNLTPSKLKPKLYKFSKKKNKTVSHWLQFKV